MVKKGHIVPATYQRNFAVDDRVAVHVVGKPGSCFPLAVENAGTRERFYRRQRNDGSEIDDIEASLSELELLAGPVLAAVTGGAPIDEEAKGALTQFFAMQLVRGPMFFSTVRDTAAAVIAEEVRPETVTAEVWHRYDGDINAIRHAARDAFWRQRFADMLGRGQKVSSILGCMRWRVLRFAEPVVAYSDQPIVVWPLGRLAIDEQPEQPTLGPLAAFEIRVPISPRLILLMTWDDSSDATLPIDAPPIFAAESNALVIAQADKQWMHRRGSRPPIARHVMRPISEVLDPTYSHQVAKYAQRRRAAMRRSAEVDGEQFVNTVQLITSITRGPIRHAGARTQRRSRR